MSARIIPFRTEPPVAPDTPIADLQRRFLYWEDDLAGEWSDSVLISLLVNATPFERGRVIAELEQRRVDREFAP